MAYKKKSLSKLIKATSSQNYPYISQTIKSIFQKNNSLYLLMLGHKVDNFNSLGKETEAEMNADLMEYKYLLHPHRLSIMKILYLEYRIASIEIRERLRISWSDYFNSIHVLENNGIIEQNEDFDDNGSIRQYISMSEKGKNEYLSLMKVIDEYVDLVKDTMPDYDRDLMYPSS